MAELLYKEESFKLIGLCMKVHTALGKGFKEVVYKDALEIELKKNNIVYEREKLFNIYYENQLLPHKFLAGFFMDNKLSWKQKQQPLFMLIHSDKTLNYLKHHN